MGPNNSFSSNPRKSKLWIPGVLLSVGAVVLSVRPSNSLLVLIGIVLLAIIGIAMTFAAKKRGSKRAIWFLALQIPCLLLTLLALVNFGILSRSIVAGTYTSQEHHYSISIPTGYAARDVAGKGLLIGHKTPPTAVELDAGKSDVMAVIYRTVGKEATSAQNIKIGEDAVIKQFQAKGGSVATRQASADKSHLLIIRQASGGREIYTGSYTKEDTQTTFFFSINCAESSPHIADYLQAVRTLTYVP